MAQHCVGKTIFDERIQRTVVLGLVNSPVFPKFFRAKNQDSLVTQFVILDDGESFKRLTKAYAVCKDAAIVTLYLVDCSLYSIFLKLKQSSPDGRIDDLSGKQPETALFLLGKVVFKEMKQRLEINEFWIVVDVKLFEITNYLVFNVGNKAGVIP